MPSRKDFRDLLKPMQVSSRTVWLWLLLWVLSVAIFLGTSVGWHPKGVQWIQMGHLVVDVLVQIISGVFAAYVFVYYYQSRERSQLDELRRVAQPDLLVDVLGDISRYQGRWCEDHTMIATLERHPDSTSNYFLCRIQHSYKKSYVPATFQAKIFRVKPGDEATNHHYPEIAEEAMSSEFVWYNDERDFPTPPNASDYALENLVVGNQRFNLTRQDRADCIVFSCRLPSFAELLTHFSFEFKLPMEKQSACFLTAEFPSRRGLISFDYSKVIGELDVAAFPKLGIHSNPLDLSRRPDGIYKYEYGDWALPKDGCVFSWWTKVPQ